MAGSLTAKEAECVRLAAARLRDKEIARELGISVGTVKKHLSSAYRKLGVSDRLEAGRRLPPLEGGSPRPIPLPPEASDQRSDFGNGPGPTGSVEPTPPRGLYGAYVRLGSWRRPRRIGGTLLPVILVWTLLGLCFLVVAFGLGNALFGAGDPVSERHYNQRDR